MTTDEKRRKLDSSCTGNCASCSFPKCYGGRPLGWDDGEIEEVYAEMFPVNPKTPYKDLSTIHRGLGIIEGVALCLDDKAQHALFTATGMISEAIDKEDSL